MEKDMELGPYEKMMGLLKEMQSALEGFKDSKQYMNHPEEDETLDDVMDPETQGDDESDDESSSKDKKKMMMVAMLKKKPLPE